MLEQGKVNSEYYNQQTGTPYIGNIEYPSWNGIGTYSYGTIAPKEEKKTSIIILENIEITQELANELMKAAFSKDVEFNLTNVTIKGTPQTQSEPDSEDEFNSIKENLINKIKTASEVVTDPLDEVILSVNTINPKEEKDVLVDLASEKEAKQNFQIAKLISEKAILKEKITRLEEKAEILKKQLPTWEASKEDVEEALNTEVKVYSEEELKNLKNLKIENK